MHRGFYVATVLVPLVLGSAFLLFGIFSDYWIRLDYSKIKHFPVDSFNSETYTLRKIRFEFPKFSSLFDECNEYKIIEVLDPIEVGSLQQSRLSLYNSEVNNQTDQIFNPTESLDNELLSEFEVTDHQKNNELVEDKNKQVI